jgi:hypothetical protein
LTIRPKTTRRQCLGYIGTAAAASAFGALALDAFGQTRPLPSPAPASLPDDEYDFLMTRVRFKMNVSGGLADWNVYPGAERYLLEEFSKIVRCKVKMPVNCAGANPLSGDENYFNAVVTLDDAERMSRYPFLFMTGEGSFTLPAGDRANLKRYIDEGGFVLIDDCVLSPSGDLLYQSAYAMLEQSFGSGSVVKIPNEHEIFHNVYDLGKIGLPHCQGVNHGARGVFAGDRLAVFLSSTDIHCGWVDRNHGWFPNPALGRHGYKEAIQMGINILMYAIAH